MEKKELCKYEYKDAQGNVFTFSYRDGQMMLTMAIIKNSLVYVPSSFTDEDGNRYPVSVIGPAAFAQQNKAKYVIISEGIKEIEDGAFASCGSLLSVYIPASVKKLGGIFWRCPTFEDNAGGVIYYPGSQEQWRELIDSNDLRVLIDYTDYDEAVCFVDEATFKLPEIEFKTEYDDELESEHTWLRVCECAGEFRVPDSYFDENGEEKTVTHIGRSSFAGNASVKKVVIPPTVKVICCDAFYDCENLEEVVIEKSSSELIICMGAFWGCKKLAKIHMGRDFYAEEYVFDKCSALTFYASAGSYAQHYAAEKGIPFSVSE